MHGKRKLLCGLPHPPTQSLSLRMNACITLPTCSNGIGSAISLTQTTGITRSFELLVLIVPSRRFTGPARLSLQHEVISVHSSQDLARTSLQHEVLSVNSSHGQARRHRSTGEHFGPFVTGPCQEDRRTFRSICHRAMPRGIKSAARGHLSSDMQQQVNGRYRVRIYY